MSLDTDIAARLSSQPSPGVPGEGAFERTGVATLTLLREWTTVCDSLGRGETQLLIRKGGIAEGKSGFELKKSFFGLLPTLFHQVKCANPDAEAPAPPATVTLLAQLVEAYSVASSTDLSSLAPLHAYTPEQLTTRQQYKPERLLHLILIRTFRLRQPIEIGPGAIRTTCRSWVDLPLEQPLGGIEAVSPIEAESRMRRDRSLIEALASVERIVP